MVRTVGGHLHWNVRAFVRLYTYSVNGSHNIDVSEWIAKDILLFALNLSQSLHLAYFDESTKNEQTNVRIKKNSRTEAASKDKQIQMESLTT